MPGPLTKKIIWAQKTNLAQPVLAHPSDPPNLTNCHPPKLKFNWAELGHTIYTFLGLADLGPNPTNAQPYL